jgi:rhodanese-related sulfurtransferase
MIEPERITPEYARKKALSGEALLVCAYEDEEKFKKMHLEGAISLNEFKNMAGSLSGEQEIIFYCA